MTETMKSFNLGKDTLYTIEAPGGVIGFDMEDHKNIDLLKKMYTDIEKAQDKYEKEHIIIEKKYKNQAQGKKDKFGMTQQDKDIHKSYSEFVNSIGKSFDSFFGQGATDKIFFDAIMNRVVITVSRVEYLLQDVLPPHFEKADIKIREHIKMKEKVVDDLLKEESEVIDLDEAE